MIDRQLLGSYSFAVVLIGSLAVISQSIQQFIIPKFSEASSNFEKVVEKLNGYQRKWMPFAILIMAVVLIIFIPFLYFFNNGKYQDSVIPFVILTIAWFFKSLTSIQGGMFFGSGFVKINLMNSIIFFIINSIFIYLLFQYVGFLGVPLGVLVANIFFYFLSKLEIIYLRKNSTKFVN